MTHFQRTVFSGHESFQCRHLWLKKGYDFASQGLSFTADDAVVHLGVGKNMVGSIRFWMRAFGLLGDGDCLTDFAHRLFSDQGYDPYLEDDASLWLLHYQLARTGYSTSYGLIFNELRKERIEFSKAVFLKFILNKFGDGVSANTINSDFEVFIKLYVGTSSSKDKEDIVSGILSDLSLVRALGDKGKDSNNKYTIGVGEREELPEEVLLFALLCDEEVGLSASLDLLERRHNSLGSIFAISRSGLLEKIERLCQRYDFMTYKDDAGIREIQFKHKPDPYQILNDYYGC
jgi:hypothetical protein